MKRAFVGRPRDAERDHPWGHRARQRLIMASSPGWRQVASVTLRDQPGWITFSLDGTHADPSTGQIIDTKSRKIVATLTDEMNRAVQSEKVVEVVFAGARVVRTGDQFGIGRRK